jgi:ribosomal peptide maturation radical SAM protein 1
MYKIALVNMPLSNLSAPTLALTQLRAVAHERFGDALSMDIHYLSHDFAHYLGVDAYLELNAFTHHASGLGEWFFRQVAYPELPENADAYFGRYYPQHDPRNRMIKEVVLAKRVGLAAHFDAMIDKYGLDAVDAVGFTSMFSQNVANLGMARRIKERNPNVVVMVGGANCEGIMGRALIEVAPVVDLVFSGPSLKSFPDVVGCLMAGDTEGIHRVNGVFTRRNHVVESGCGTPGAALTEGSPEVRMFGEERDLNDYVELDYDAFLDAYETNFPGMGKATLYFETSRGCWWGERAHCTFCGLNGSTISYRSMRIDLAHRLLGSLFHYQGRCSQLSSVDNILPKSYFGEFLPFLDTPPDMELFYEVKADLDEADFIALRKARVMRIQPGIEALNTSTLKLMRKGTSSFQNIMFLANAVRYGIEPAWNLLIGFPGEELEIYEKYLVDLPLLTHLFPPGGVFPVRFDRFSPYFDEVDRYQLDLHPLDWYPLTYPFEAGVLFDLAYYFSDHNFSARYATNAARMVAKLRDKVDRWTRLWVQPEELRPRLELRERDGEGFIFDSRTGSGTEYPVTIDARRLLEALVTPKKVVNLVKELPDVAVEAELEWLRQRGLVFVEGDRSLSLVLEPMGPASERFAELEAAAAA